MSIRLDAVEARYVEIEDRGFLEIDRFDRVVGGGRVGHTTLYYLGISLFGEVQDAARVIDGLVDAAVLTERDRERFLAVHTFSSAIGNTDTHLGNYGLLIDDEGHASLAPAYDVLPMMLAPRHDELPDRHLGRADRPNEATRALVERLVTVCEGDAGISGEFRSLWRSVLNE